MAKFRSPVLGFNHNVRHLGWVFHVQTEDSGVQNPHIFTHLFHEGVILASKKMVYDANSDVDVVKGLMQAQHKSVLKELKSGQFDAKIRQYLGTPPDEAGAGDAEFPEMEVSRDVTPPPGPVPAAAAEPPPPTTADVSAAFRAISHASAQMSAVDPPPPSGAAPVATAPTQALATAPTQAAPAAAPPPETDAEAAMVFSAPNAPPVPPGVGVWSGKPEITQERPFDKSGSYPAVKPPGEPRNARQSMSPPPSGTPAQGRTPTGPPKGKPPTTPPGQGAGARQTGRQTGAPPTPAGTPAARAPGTPPPIPTTARPQGAPPQGAQRPPAGGARQGGGTRPPGAAAGTAPPPSRPQAPPRPATTPPPTGRGPGSQPPAGARPGSNVVVARPAVIVGGPSQVVGGGQPGTRPPTGRPREATPPPGQDSIFGKDLISEKSLDEVIMAYLSEDAPEE